MSTVKTKILNTVVVGSGLASLSFLDAYLSKKQSVDVISPNFSKDLDLSLIHISEPTRPY